MKNILQNTWGIFLFMNLVLSSGIRAEDNTDKMFPNLVLTREHFDKWKSSVDNNETSVPKEAYENHIRLLALKIIRDEITPSPVSSLSATGANSSLVSADMQRMYTLCLYYAFTQNQIYLDKALEFYLAWAAVNTAVSENSPGETIYTPAIEGYSIIRNLIDESSRNTIDAWMRRRATVARNDRVRTNNWETIRLQYLLFYGLVLDDATLLEKFNTGLSSFIPINLYPNGTSEDLLGRDAFAYHAYNLLFYARILRGYANYYGLESADALYAKEYKWGSSIRKAVDFWKPYILYPEKYTHAEFVETEWAPDKQRNDYNKAYNPSGTTYVVDELYFMDQELYPCIQKYRGNTLNATLPLWLSALRWY